MHDYLAGVDEEGVVDLSYCVLRRPIASEAVEEDVRSFSIAGSCGGAKPNRAKGGFLHSRTPLAYMPSFPLQMHSYVKCKVQMHNDYRVFFWSFMHFGKYQVHVHNGWSCSYRIQTLSHLVAILTFYCTFLFNQYLLLFYNNTSLPLFLSISLLIFFAPPRFSCPILKHQLF